MIGAEAPGRLLSSGFLFFHGSILGAGRSVGICSCVATVWWCASQWWPFVQSILDELGAAGVWLWPAQWWSLLTTLYHSPEGLQGHCDTATVSRRPG